MRLFGTIAAIVSSWTEGVAAAIVNGIDRLVSPLLVRLIEEQDGVFSLYKGGVTESAAVPVTFDDGTLSGANIAATLRGARVEIVLRASRFLFRPLELPARAAAFLDGVVRAQIDRLTPWSTSEAVFGASVPRAIGADQIVTVIAATARSVAMPYVQSIMSFQPVLVAIYTGDTDQTTAPIKVFEQRARGLVDAKRLSRALLALLAIACAAVVLSVSANLYLADRLETQQGELNRQITARRTAFQAGRDAADQSPTAVLERRKYEIPASVIVLEALSQVLPDHTFVTELHIAGNKLQVVGITRDAPSLIRLIEQAPHFTRATFFAPTTRTPSDPGERFHIEARIEPLNGPNP